MPSCVSISNTRNGANPAKVRRFWCPPKCTEKTFIRDIGFLFYPARIETRKARNGWAANPPTPGAGLNGKWPNRCCSLFRAYFTKDFSRHSAAPLFDEWPVCLRDDSCAIGDSYRRRRRGVLIILKVKFERWRLWRESLDLKMSSFRDGKIRMEMCRWWNYFNISL